MTENTFNRFELKRQHCKERCYFNVESARYSEKMYEKHWNSKNHIPFDFTDFQSITSKNNSHNYSDE